MSRKLPGTPLLCPRPKYNLSYGFRQIATFGLDLMAAFDAIPSVCSR